MSIGIKGFLNQWKHTFDTDNGANDVSLTKNHQISNGKIGFIIGPSLKMSYKNFFGGIGYLTTLQSYKTDQYVDKFYDYYNNDYSARNYEEKFEYDRQDIDFIAGYMLNPRFGLFAGLKYLIYEAYSPSVIIKDYQKTYADYFYCKFTGERKSIGPALGITANYPFLNNNFVTSISLSLMYLTHNMDSVYSADKGERYTYSATGHYWNPTLGGYNYHSDMKQLDNDYIKKINYSESDSDYGWGLNIEPGISYIMNEKISLTLGFRCQRINNTISLNGTYDIFYGVSLGCDYRFL